MPRRSFQKGELLLVLLKILVERPMSEREIVSEAVRLLDRDYRVSTAAVLLGLGALEGETLVEAEANRGSAVYRITEDGLDALGPRASAPVLAQAERAARSQSPSESPAAHRLEQTTVVFTDLVGSTALLDRRGADVAHELRRRHFALLRGLLHQHEGREVKSLGDGLMVVFASARDAATCALAMQLAVAGGEDRLQLRIGIASGETVNEDGDYFGRPVIVARRLCDAAPGEGILVAEPTHDLVAGAIPHEVESLGPLSLKGLSEPVTASAMRPQAAQRDG